MLSKVVIEDLKDKTMIQCQFVAECIQACLTSTSYAIDDKFETTMSDTFWNFLYPIISPSLLKVHGNNLLNSIVIDGLSSKYCFLLIQRNFSICMEILRFHSRCLELALKRCISLYSYTYDRVEESIDDRESSLLVVNKWICSTLSDVQMMIMHFYSSNFSMYKEKAYDYILNILDLILGCWIPLTTNHLNSTLNISSSLNSLTDFISILEKFAHDDINHVLAISPYALFRYMSSCLLSSSEIKVCKMIEILCSVLPFCLTTYPVIISKDLVFMSQSISYIFSASSLHELSQVAQKMSILVETYVASYEGNEIERYGYKELGPIHILNELKYRKANSGVYEVLDYCEVDKICSIGKRIMLIFYLSLFDSNDLRGFSMKSIENMLDTDPDLCTRLLTVIFVLINKNASSNSAMVLDLIRFLCNVAPKNKLSTKQIWSFITISTSTGNPVHIRSSFLRLCSNLLRGNRRLFRKVSDLLLSFVSDPFEEVRLAVVAAISEICNYNADLAVNDFVGVLQHFLRDESTNVKALSLRSLHNLCVNDTMDFDLLIRALKKRLNFTFDFKSILNEEEAIAYEVINILGDGECNMSEESDESGSISIVSEETKKAISLLIDIAVELLTKSNSSKLLLTVIKNLARYSLASLELDVELVRKDLSLYSSGLLSDRYSIFIQIVSDLVTRNWFHFEESSEIIKFARVIVDLENDALGRMLWRKSNIVVSMEKDYVVDLGESVDHYHSILPLPGTLFETYNCNPSSEAALGVLYSIDTSNDKFDDINNIISDLLCEVECVEDFIDKVITVNGWIEAIRRICSIASKLDIEVKQILKELSKLSVHDNFMLAITSYCFINDSSQEGFLDFLEYAYHNVSESIISSKFESLDNSFICLSLIGSCFVSSNQFERLDYIIDDLESSLKVGGSFFGAHLGMSIVSQALVNDSLDENSSATLNRLKRILLILFNEFVMCIDNFPTNVEETMKEILKHQSVDKSITEFSDIRSSQKFIVSEKNIIRCQSLCLALAVAVPCFAVINVDLCVYFLHLSIQLPAGVRKGFLISSSYNNCNRIGMFDYKEKQRLYASFLRAVKDENNEFEDFMIVISACSDPTSESYSKDLNNLEKLHGRILTNTSLKSKNISMCLYVANIPCLDGTRTFGSAAKIKVGVQQDVLKKVVSYFIEKEHIPCENLFYALKGLLCSMGTRDLETSDKRLFRIDRKATNHPNTSTIKVKDRDKIIVNEHTLTGMICNYLQSDIAAQHNLSVPLAMFQSSQLPTSFIYQVQEIIDESIKTRKFDQFKSCLFLLVSQIKMRRGVSEKKLFIDLFVRCCCDHLQLIKESFLDHGSLIVVSAFEEVALFLPSSDISSMMKTLLTSCLNKNGNLAINPLRALLECLGELLDRCLKRGDISSPKDKQHFQTICQFILDIHDILANFPPLVAGMTDLVVEYLCLWTKYFKCLSFVPLEQYEQFISPYIEGINSPTLCHVFACVSLLYYGYFDSHRLKHQLERFVGNWILSTSDSQAVNQLLSLNFTRSRTNVTDDSKRKILLDYLDLMLVDDTNLVNIIDSFASQVNFWHANILHADSSTVLFHSNVCDLLSKHDLICLDRKTVTIIFESLLGDLPLKLRRLGTHLRVSNEIENKLFRLLDRKSNETNISVLKQAFLESYSGDNIERFILIVES